jgi:hypothetical protein
MSISQLLLRDRKDAVAAVLVEGLAAGPHMLCVGTADGRLTCAEVLGHREFVPTKLYRSV